MRKYKRRFAPYNGSNGGSQQQPPLSATSTTPTANGVDSLNGLDTNSNLYLLASSRQHHRLMNGGTNGDLVKEASNGHGSSDMHRHHHYDHISQKLIVDRLSPISDPDLEAGARNGKGHHHHHHNHHHHNLHHHHGEFGSMENGMSKLANGNGMQQHMKLMGENGRMHHRGEHQSNHQNGNEGTFIVIS